jgi:hypothetical protein
LPRGEESSINEAGGIDLTGPLGCSLACRSKREAKAQYGGWVFCLFLWHGIRHHGFTDRERKLYQIPFIERTKEAQACLKAGSNLLGEEILTLGG